MQTRAASFLGVLLAGALLSGCATFATDVEHEQQGGHVPYPTGDPQEHPDPRATPRSRQPQTTGSCGEG